MVEVGDKETFFLPNQIWPCLDYNPQIRKRKKKHHIEYLDTYMEY